MRVIGAATSLGQPRSGVEHGPAAIRKAGLVKEAESENIVYSLLIS